MNIYLAQLLFLARDGDAEFWMEILVVVFVAVFWGIGALLKKAQKFEPKDEKRPSTPKAGLKLRQKVGRPTGPAITKPADSPVQPPVETSLRPQTAKHKPVVQKRPVHIPTTKTLKDSNLPRLGLQLDSKLQELPVLTPKTIKKPKTAPIIPPQDTTSPIEPGRPLLDYDDPDALRRAILHYEILGKPLSRREPGDNIAGL